MKIANFIVLDDRPNRKQEYHHTVNGEVYIPLETTVPVIQRGYGCIGLGMVTEIVMRKDSTTIIFTMSKVGKDAADAYYSLYKNQVTMNESDDVYDQASDVIIPGMMASTAKSTPKPKRSSSTNYNSPLYDGRRSNSSSGSLMEYLEDDPHW